MVNYQKMAQKRSPQGQKQGTEQPEHSFLDLDEDQSQGPNQPLDDNGQKRQQGQNTSQQDGQPERSGDRASATDEGRAGHRNRDDKTLQGGQHGKQNPSFQGDGFRRTAERGGRARGIFR